MARNVIEIQRLGKRYVLGEQQAAYGTLRDSIAHAFSRRRGRDTRREIWALRDFDMTVAEGEAVGIIGTNGAGKSTLLKILSRITEPTTGTVRTRGRVGVLLEVGTGFHPELTGRENVYLSGAVMGMSRREVRRRFDEIVAFSGVERFLETPLKRYSSGMQLRLAFAVAAHLEPELMLVDEVLAVGDVAFQRRCMQRMSRLSAEGRTVIFVSHDLGAITRLCSRAVWADRGRPVAEGRPSDVVQAYYAAMLSDEGRAHFDLEREAGVTHVAIVDERGELLPRPERGRPFRLEARVRATEDVPQLDLEIYVLAADGSVVLSEFWSDQPGMPELLPAPGEYVVRLTVPPILPAGDYAMGVKLRGAHDLFFDRTALRFSVVPMAGDRDEWSRRRRALQLAEGWTREPAPEGTGSPVPAPLPEGGR